MAEPAAPTVLVSARGISKQFAAIEVLRDVDLDLMTGEIHALLGENGAGKSTFAKILAGVHRPSRGTLSLNGRPVDISSPIVAQGLGITLIHQEPISFPDLSVAENVAFVGESYGMRAADVRERSAELLERAGLASARDRLGRELSGGMRQKLGFVLAILHRPRLVLLDEPSTGVDPVSRVELWRLISSTATDGAAVLLATTYLDEAQRAASVTALDHGRAIATGTPEEIVDSMPGRIALTDGPASRDSWRPSGSRGPRPSTASPSSPPG